MPLRTRILLGALPLLLLLAGVGGYAVWLFVRLGGAVNTTLRENYESVAAMRDLRESALRIDRALSFQRAGAAEAAQTRVVLDAQAAECRQRVEFETNNITEAGERELANQLRERNETFLASADAAVREEVNPAATANADLRRPLDELLTAALAVQRLNERAMTAKDQNARATAATSTRVMLGAIALALPVAGFFAFRLLRTIRSPLAALTQSARALGEGNLDQVLPVTGQDELGQLADAFNKMAGKLREYRQTTDNEVTLARQATGMTFAALPDPIVVYADDGAVTYQNPAAERLRKRLHGASFAPLPVMPIASEVLHGGGDYLPDSFEKAICVRLDDRETFLLPRVVGFRDGQGQVHGAVAILQDVTRFRLLDDVKTNLVATVSHELKTPLTSLRMAVHLLLEERIGALNPKQTELLIAAREDSERLLDLINNLLDLARLESGAASRERRPNQPDDMVRRAVADAREMVGASGQRLVVQADANLPAVLASTDQLDHVFSNLISNAAKHSPPGEEIAVAARAADGGRAVRFAVVDRGPGVPAAERERVFEKFYRLPGESREGAGLGLAICREIVRAHDGRIGVTDGPDGRGSEFFFILPAATTAVATAAVTPSDQPPSPTAKL